MSVVICIGLVINICLVVQVRLAAGAEFVVAVCGEIMTMPGSSADC